MKSEDFTQLTLKPLNLIPTKKPQKVCGFDIETAGSSNEFVLACLNGDGISEAFTSTADLLSFLDSDKARGYVFVATNLGFDFLGCLMENTERWNICERDGRIYSFKYYQHGQKKRPLKFYDTLNYFPASVEKLGSVMGIPKLPHPKCFKRKPETFEELEELKEYCMNDAYISYRFFKDRIVQWSVAQGIRIKSTIASMSLDNFRTNYLKSMYRVAQPHIHNIIYKAYYGGRTEVFKRGTFYDVNCYDFNSLYPSVMVNEYPNPNSMQRAKASNMHIIDNYEGVSYVEGWLPKKYIPILPSRTESKLIFPVNRIKGHYTHVELRKAVEEGFKISKFGESVFYLKSENLFREFIEHSYQKRLKQKEMNDALELMTKLSMNSLYGKFGFNYRKSNSMIPLKQATKKQFDSCAEFRIYGDFVEFVNNGTRPTSYSFPILSAYTTAYARLKLYDWLSNENLRDFIIYCDTDSLFVDENMRLPSSDKLGELKHEYYIDEGIFVKPKFYITNKVKIKGVKGIRDRHAFVELLENPVVCNERFIKYRSAVKSKDAHKFGKLSINQIIEIQKKLKLEDTKRKWFNEFNYRKQEDSRPIAVG